MYIADGEEVIRLSILDQWTDELFAIYKYVTGNTRSWTPLSYKRDEKEIETPFERSVATRKQFTHKRTHTMNNDEGDKRLRTIVRSIYAGQPPRDAHPPNDEKDGAGPKVGFSPFWASP